MRLGIVTVVYAEYPAVLFDSLQGESEHEIHWHVHCHSTDPEIERGLVAFCATHDCTLTLHGWNRGLARSWNDGILEAQAAGADVILVVNDDIAFLEGGLSAWLEFIGRYPNFGLAFLQGLEVAGPNAGQVMCQDFACFAFGPAAWEAVGAFDENFFPAYSEDTDYIIRAHMAGIPTVVDKRVLVDHARNKTTRTATDLAETINPLKARNTAYLTGKWGDIYGGGELHRSPWGRFGLRIAWEDRHAPFGDDFDRAELRTLEPVRRRIVSSALADSRTGGERLPAAPVPPEPDAAVVMAVVAVVYKALLRRDVEPEAQAFYAGRLRSSAISVEDLCDEVRRSEEYRNLTAISPDAA